MFNFYEYIQNLNLFAIVDFVVLAVVTTLLSLLFVYKRNIKVLLILLASACLDVLFNVLSNLIGKNALALSSAVFHYLFLFVIVCLPVVYATDIRSFIQKISNPHKIDLYSEGFGGDEELRFATDEILTACQNMAKQNIGAIIVITKTSHFPDAILETGTKLGSNLSAALLESIFNTKAPLHDGAVVVKGNKVMAAGCFLPLTQKNLSRDMGTRHRAAVGIEEEADVLSIVISEETGIISIVGATKKDNSNGSFSNDSSKGEIKRYITMDRLKDEIEEAFGISPNALEKKAQNEKKQRKKL